MVRARIALSAAVEPMLMSESSEVTRRETRTAFRGMLEPGVILESQL